MDANDSIARLIRELGSRNPEHAWSEFLRIYASLILQVVRLFERDQDPISDCFLYVCEQLSRRRFRRLRKFRPDGPAKFETWLRAVVRNLCLDWHRKEFGRHRIFRSIASLPALDQEVFHGVFGNGFSPEYAFAWLAPRFPALTPEDLQACIGRIEAILTPRQRWLLSVRSGRRETRRLEDMADGPVIQAVDTQGNPETQATLEEQRDHLSRELRKLTASERLLLRLRFEEDLTLEQIARMFKLADAQTADRRIRQLLERLRRGME
ncbi:MAG: sigma-70 family RNA polymerase sigma factor [Verrucomicrobiales bacterium]|nr:sigma-70 family RNA polymerase sigma factor [Verrucomicrobiales bacterium]